MFSFFKCIAMDGFFGFSTPIFEHIIRVISDYEYRYLTWTYATQNQTIAISRTPWVAICFGSGAQSSETGPLLVWPGFAQRFKFSNSGVVSTWTLTFNASSISVQTSGWSGTDNHPPEGTYTLPTLFAFFDPKYVQSAKSS